MRRFASIVSVWLGVTLFCAPLPICAEGHHQSGIVGQARLPAHIVELPGVGGNPPTFVVVLGDPIQTQIEIFSEKGVLVGETMTDAEGQFAVPLKPGTYTLLPSPLSSSPELLPVPTAVAVTKKEWITSLVAYAYSPM